MQHTKGRKAANTLVLDALASDFMQRQLQKNFAFFGFPAALVKYKYQILGGYYASLD